MVVTAREKIFFNFHVFFSLQFCFNLRVFFVYELRHALDFRQCILLHIFGHCCFIRKKNDLFSSSLVSFLFGYVFGVALCVPVERTYYVSLIMNHEIPWWTLRSASICSPERHLTKMKHIEKCWEREKKNKILFPKKNKKPNLDCDNDESDRNRCWAV